MWTLNSDTLTQNWPRPHAYRASEIAHFKLLVAKLQHMLFGAKSEKVLHHIEQLKLKLEELETESAEESIKVATGCREAFNLI